MNDLTVCGGQHTSATNGRLVGRVYAHALLNQPNEIKIENDGIHIAIHGMG